MSSPRISVVIPVLNSVATIEKAIRSVLDQAYPNIELIILDAGSTDGTVEVIKRYESQLAYWHSKPDGSPGIAINFGLSKATGEITGQLMADDWYESNTFKKAATAYCEHPDIDIISFAGRIVAMNDNQLLELERYDTANALEITLSKMCYGIPALNARFITRKYLQKIGLLKPLSANGKHNYSTDRELLIRAAVFGCNNIFVPHLGHTYLAHSESATFGNNRATQNKILQEHMDYVKSYFSHYTLTIQQKKVLRGWYADQSVRLWVRLCMAGKFWEAMLVAKQGLVWAAGPWIGALFHVPARWLRKNLLACRLKKKCYE